MGARKKLALEQFNRDNILTAARELFETKGVQDTTMDDIALQADYSKSTIYVYFRSKEDIYNSIVVDYLDILIGEMTVYIEGDTSFEDSYYKLCERLVSFCERYPKYYASLMFEEKATNSRKQGTVILPEILQELYGLMEALVQKGKKHKRVTGNTRYKADGFVSLVILKRYYSDFGTEEKRDHEADRDDDGRISELCFSHTV